MKSPFVITSNGKLELVKWEKRVEEFMRSSWLPEPKAPRRAFGALRAIDVATKMIGEK